MANRVCDICHEEYSDTYRKCPFCAEAKRLQKGKPLRQKGGRRISTAKRGGVGGIVALLLVVVLVGAGALFFFNDHVTEVLGIRTQSDLSGDLPVNSQTDSTSQTEQPSPSTDEKQPSDSAQQTPDDTTQQPPVDTTQQTEQTPAEPAGPLAISQSNITIASGTTARLTTTGGTGSVKWSTSNVHIATVKDGSITGVAGGTVTITAEAGGETVSCTVTVTGTPWVSDAQLSLNRTDITLRAGDPPFQMKVKGTDSAVVWASNNPSVAVINESGVVSRGSQKGTTKITASVDGHVLECIIRVP